MPSVLNNGSTVIHKLLMDRSVPPKEECLAGDHSDDETIGKLYDSVLAIRETLKSFSKGNFDVQLTERGVIWGHLKALQANFQHLAWKVEQIAAGDFSQRVDFMGNLSSAFNKMAQQLEHSLEEIKEREAAERTQIMLDATPLCCSFWNDQHQILDCNQEALKLYDLNSKQEYFERFFDLVPKFQPDGRLSSEVVHEMLDEAFEKGYARCEFLHQKLNGEQIPGDIILVRVRQKDQYLVVSYNRDLRELKQKQSTLDQQRLLLLDVLNSTPICFAILAEEKIKFSSAFLTQFLGLNVGEPIINCFADQEKGTHLLTRVQKDSRIEWEPVAIRSKDNGIREMLANLFLTEYYGEQGIIVWLVDITEIKKIEADLRIAKDTAEQLGRVKDEFIANMSHELRTPMNVVLGILHLLHNTSLSEEQTSYILTMESSAKRLLQIINDILDFSQIESGKIFITSEPFDVRQIFANVQSVLREVANAKKLPLICRVEDNVPPVIIGDSLKLQQILVSLADNAIKFTEQGSVQILAHVESWENENIVLRLSVQDTGIGMAAEKPAQMFQSFSQGDSSGTRKYGGIGLGLSIVKNLVEMMGGQIWWESKISQGTTFYFTLTFEVQKVELETIVFPDSFQNMPILLVEDNNINQIVAKKMLQEKGFLVDVAPNGLRAVEMVAQKDYALVLMDIQMPEMDGIQATQVIRSDSKNDSLAIIALTANAMEDDRRCYLEAGMNDLVAKPMEPTVLYQAILKWARPCTKMP